MENKLEKEVRFLKIYAVAATLFCAVFFLSAFAFQNKKQKFDEIDVGRINVVEKDGKLKMIITNKERSPELFLDGKEIKVHSYKRPAGMYFFNEKGDENGGLVFPGEIKDGKVEAFGGLLFDQFNQDQSIGLMYEEENGKRYSALQVWDRPDNLSGAESIKRQAEIDKMPDGAEKTEAQKKLQADRFVAQRVFVGREKDKSASIYLMDTKRKPRIIMTVSGADGTPKLEFLDEAGKVIYRLPEENKAGKK